jgi:hypothetical protein
MKLRDWSLRRWLLVGAVMLVLPLVAMRLHLKWRVHRAVAELKAAGSPTTWEELGRYYNTMAGGVSAGPNLTNIFRQLPQHDLTQSANLPVVGHAMTPPPGEPWPEPMREATGEYLDSLQEGLELLCAALDSSAGRYDRDFNPRLFQMVQRATLRAAASRLMLESYYALDQADWKRAVRANKALFQLTDTLREEPDWIGQLNRNAVAAMAIDTCQRLLGVESGHDEGLASLQTVIGNSMGHTSLRHVIAGERVNFLEWVKPGSELLTLNLDAEYESGEWSEYWERFKVLLYRMSGLADQDVLWLLSYSRKLEGSLGEDLWEHQRVVDEWQSHRPQSQGMRFAFWSKQFTQIDDRVITKHIEMHAKLRAAHAALAVAQYRLQHDGKLPASLDELVPEFLEAVPVEPQSGQQFELITTLDGYGIGRGTPLFNVKLPQP